MVVVVGEKGDTDCRQRTKQMAKQPSRARIRRPPYNLSSFLHKLYPPPFIGISFHNFFWLKGAEIRPAEYRRDNDRE